MNSRVPARGASAEQVSAVSLAAGAFVGAKWGFKAGMAIGGVVFGSFGLVLGAILEKAFS